jgi:hypothetical protein
VLWSAEKVGFSDKTVWKHRMNHPRFAEAFDRAFEQSLMRNKARMVERKAKEKPIAVDGGVGEAELEECDLEKAWPLIVEVERAKGRSRGSGVSRRGGLPLSLKPLRFASARNRAKAPPATEDSVLSAAGAGGGLRDPRSFRGRPVLSPGL